MPERNRPEGSFHSSEFGSSSEAFDYSELLSPEVRERYREWRKTDAAKAMKARQDKGHRKASEVKRNANSC